MMMKMMMMTMMMKMMAVMFFSLMSVAGVSRALRSSSLVLSDGLCQYGWTQNSPGPCTPVCESGCKHGECVGPDECRCHAGYTGKTCNQDVNECAFRPCKYRCMNTLGSYKCYCLNGYMMMTDGTCRNARTCAMANCQYGCAVMKGQVTCQCPSPGLRLSLDGRTCVDVDECVTGQAKCPRFRKCVNTFGSYICRCHDGFELQHINGKYHCTDKKKLSVCYDKPGHMKCKCKASVHGKSYDCKPVVTVIVEPARPVSPTTITTTTGVMTTTSLKTTTPRKKISPTTADAMTTTVPTTTVTPTTDAMTTTVPTTTVTPTTDAMTTTVPTTTVTPTTEAMTTTVPTTTVTPTTDAMTTTVPTTTVTPTTDAMTTTVPTTTVTPTTDAMTTTVPTTTVTPTTDAMTTTVPTTTVTPTTDAMTTTVPTTTVTPTTDAMTTTVPTTTVTPTTDAMTTTVPTTTVTPTTDAMTTTVPTTTVTPTSDAMTTTVPTTTVTPTTDAMTTTVPTTAASNLSTPSPAETPPATTITATTSSPEASTTLTKTGRTTTLDNHIHRENTPKPRGDVYIPRYETNLFDWDFDVELGNTAEYTQDDPGASAVSCTFDEGLCVWMSDSGDLHWNITEDPAGGRYLTVPKATNRRSIRGARLTVPLGPPTKAWRSRKLCVTFRHRLHGHHIGSLQMFVRKGRSHSPSIWTSTGGHGWRHTQITLWGRGLDDIVLKGERRRGKHGEIAVDDFSLRRGACTAP